MADSLNCEYSPAFVATVVTTCPRIVDYLPQTLQSLTGAGFLGVMVSNDAKKAGNVANYRNALEMGLRLRPDARQILILEDDVIVAKGLAAWIEMWRDFVIGDWAVGAQSLYCPTTHNRLKEGWFFTQYRPIGDDEASIVNAPGACAILWERHMAVRFLADTKGRIDIPQVDMLIANWCGEKRYQYAIHYPSLVQHVGNASTLSILPKPSDANVPLPPARMADSFIDDVHLLREYDPCREISADLFRVLSAKQSLK